MKAKLDEEVEKDLILLSEIKAAVTGCGTCLWRRACSPMSRRRNMVVTPLADTYELHADNLPEFETQEARLSCLPKATI